MAERTHRIRLTGAWERSEQGEWLRHFVCPSGLDGNQRVRLVVSGRSQEPQLRLNGQPLGLPESRKDREQAWDVTSLLVARNRLILLPEPDIDLPPAAGRSPLPAGFGEVLLEIVDRRMVNNA